MKHYRLVDRHFFAAGTSVTSIPANSFVSVSNIVLLYALTSTQRMRILTGFAAIAFDPNNTAKLKCLSISLYVQPPLNLGTGIIRSWPSNYTPDLIGSNGAMVTVPDDQDVYFLDGKEVANFAFGGFFSVFCNCDIQNIDAVAHNVSLSLSGLVELHELVHPFAGVSRLS